MPTIYCVHAAEREGQSSLKASRITMAEALKEAKLLLMAGASHVWIADKDGKLILPDDQLKARLDPATDASGGFRTNRPSRHSHAA
jgi:hypothetical protein